MGKKRSDCELKRLIEEAVETECELSSRGLWFCVNAVEVQGHPPSRIQVWGALHFLPTGSPFCCGEPGCHLGLHGERLQRVREHLRRAMRLTQLVVVEFGDRIEARYHFGVEFQITVGKL